MYNEIIRVAQELHPAELSAITYAGARALAEAGLISPGAVAEIKEAVGIPTVDEIIVNDESDKYADEVHIYYSVDIVTWGPTGHATKWFHNLDEAKECAKDPYAGTVVEHIISDAFDVEDIESIIRTQREW